MDAHVIAQLCMLATLILNFHAEITLSPAMPSAA